MYISDSRWNRPSENPQADSESRTSNSEGSNFRLGENATFLCAEFLEKVVVVEARQDIEENTDEDGDEGQGGRGLGKGAVEGWVGVGDCKAFC